MATRHELCLSQGRWPFRLCLGMASAHPRLSLRLAHTQYGEASHLWPGKLVDPDQPACRARPIWHAAADPGALMLVSSRAGGRPQDRLDLLQLAPWLSVTIDASGDEHWLLSDGLWSVRIDVIADTLLAGPLEPNFNLRGLARLDRAMRALERLRALAGAGILPVHLQAAEVKSERWIAELRAADALSQGATTREIAEGLFDIDVVGDAWKIQHESYRSRTPPLSEKRMIDCDCL